MGCTASVTAVIPLIQQRVQVVEVQPSCDLMRVASSDTAGVRVSAEPAAKDSDHQ